MLLQRSLACSSFYFIVELAAESEHDEGAVAAEDQFSLFTHYLSCTEVCVSQSLS